MSCYVDNLQPAPRAWLRTRRGVVASEFCHLIADTERELHAMADAIGLKRSWFQDAASAPHYDLTPSRRAEAVRRGAREVDRFEFVQVIRRLRAYRAVPPKSETEKGGAK